MAVIASRPELPASFHSSSYSPSASPRVRPVSDLSQRERHSSTASAHTPSAQQQTYRQSWASDSSTTRPRSVSSGNVTVGKERDRESVVVDDISSRDQEQLDRPSFPRTNSGSSSLSARRPLEPSLAANMSSRDVPRRQASPNAAAVGSNGMRRPASDRELDERYDGKSTAGNEWDGPHDQHQHYAHQQQLQQQQHHQQQQSQIPQQYGYFPPPNQPWATAPQRSGSPSSGPSPGSTPMYFPAYSPPAQLPPQIQQLSPSAQQAYLQAMAQHHYQNNQAGIAAWASAYHQGMMMAAHQQNSSGQYPGQMYQGPSMPRSISTQSSVSAMGESDPAQTQQHQREQVRSASGNSTSSAAAGYHPYRRQPSKTNVAGKERKRETSSQGSGSVRDSSAIHYPEADDEVLREHAPAPPRHEGVRMRASFDDAQRARIRRGSSASSEHVPTAKIVAPSRKLVQQAVMESSQAGRGQSHQQGGAHHGQDEQPFDDTPPRRNMHKRQSSSTSSVGEVIKPTLMNATTGSSMDSPTSSHTAQHEGLNPAAREWKPSPLAQTNNAPIDTTRQAGRSVSDIPKKEADKKEKTGLRGKLQKAMKRDNEPVKITPKSPIKQATPVITTSVSAPATLHQANDSVGSTSTTTRSTTPPITPPQPATPAGLGNRRPSNSSFAPSLIEPLDGRGGKPKRSLFNMRNASTDNISISSTVSSASMMIRKMGALGKIARRNR